MKKMMIVALAFALAGLVGCQGLDVVLEHSPAALDSLLASYPELLQDKTAEENYYVLSADGETQLKISSNYTATGEEDLVLVTPLAPFVAAGLDPAKLGEGYRADDQNLYLTADYGDGEAQGTPSAALLQSAKNNRKVLSYHMDMDHYGIDLPRGKFEYAKEHETNDKDLVFIIAAAPLVQLGVDVENVEGWAFMQMDDMKGGKVDLLLKPYAL